MWVVSASLPTPMRGDDRDLFNLRHVIPSSISSLILSLMLIQLLLTRRSALLRLLFLLLLLLFLALVGSCSLIPL